MIHLVLALTLAAGAGEGASPAPVSTPDAFNARCRPVLGGTLRPGAWGLVSVDADNRFNAALRPGMRQDVRGSRHDVWALPALGPGERREYLVPFRPIPGAGGIEALLDDRAMRQFPDLVGGADARAVALVGRLDLPAGAPPGFAASRAEAAELPLYPAAYEGLDALVIGELDGTALSAAQRDALRTWFRAGGRALVASASARRELADVLFEAGGEFVGAKSWEEWKRLSGASDEDVLAWAGQDGAREPLVVRFSTGFGRGAFLWPERWMPEESGAAWSAYQRLLDMPRAAPLVPGRDRAIYENFPPLAGSLFGAGSALRWALGIALLVSTAGTILWRRGHPWRLSGAATAAALLAAILTISLASAPDGRALSVRIDEFSADGAGVRARELLYLEAPADGWRAEVDAVQGSLPSVVLPSWEDAGGFASRLDLPAPGSTGGPRLSGVEPGTGGLFVGAGPLPRAMPMGARPEGAVALAGLRDDACVAAIAGCLSAERGRCRRQAETIAGWLWRDLAARGMLSADAAVYVCRLPDEPAALAPAGRVQAERLGRLGIFYADTGASNRWK